MGDQEDRMYLTELKECKLDFLEWTPEKGVKVRSRHRTNYAQVSSGCLGFQDHNHELKSNFMKTMPNLFCDSYLVTYQSNLQGSS